MTGSSADDPCCAEQRAASLERIYHYLDGELDQRALADIEHHLATCTQCREDLSVESLLKELVRRSCRGEQAPAGLRERIRASIVVSRGGTVHTTTVTSVTTRE